MKTENITIPPGTDLNDLAEKIDFAELLAGVEVRQTDVIPRPPTCLFVEEKGERSVLGTLGNFSFIKGKAKSRKSFAVGVAVAAALSSGPLVLKIGADFPPEKRVVLYFDTEQSRYHVQRVVSRISALCGMPAPENLKVFALRKFDTDTRRDAIQWAIYNTEGVGLVVIDGIRDLVHDPNDLKESTATVNLLLRWTEERWIHVLTVLHENKTDANARGHIGTELQNKAETVVAVSRDQENKSVSIVAAELCRDKDFDEFRFEINDHGIPCLVEAESTAGSNQFPVRSVSPSRYANRPRKPSPYTLNAEKHEALLTAAFTEKEPGGYEKTWRRIKLAAEAMGLEIGDNTAKQFLHYYQDEGRITKQPLKNGALYTVTTATSLGSLNRYS